MSSLSSLGIDITFPTLPFLSPAIEEDSKTSPIIRIPNPCNVLPTFPENLRPRSLDLSKLIKEVNDSKKKILNLKEDWDGEGGKPYDFQTWKRAIDFILRTIFIGFYRFGYQIDPPEILPGPNENIDLYWKKRDFELLVNIPKENDKVGDFYGDNYDQLKIKGTFKPESQNLGIILWLISPK